MAMGMIFNPYTAGRFGPRPPAGVVGQAASASTPAAVPTSLTDALAAPAAPEKQTITIGPESDALAKALLAQASQGGNLRTPFEAVGRLAQLWAGTTAEEKFQKAQRSRDEAPWNDLQSRIDAGEDPLTAALHSKNPDVFKWGLENKVKGGAKRDAPTGYQWDQGGTGLQAIPGGPADKSHATPDAPNGYRWSQQTGALEAIPGGPADKTNAVPDAPAGYRWKDGALEAIPGGPAIAKPGFHAMGPGEIGFDDAGNPIAGVPAKPEDQWVDQPPDSAGNVRQRNQRTGELRDAIKSDLISPEALAQKKALAEASRSAINVNPQESKYSQTIGEGLGGIGMDIAKNAMKASGVQASLDRLDQLSADPNFYSGAGANLVQQAKKVLAAVDGSPETAALAASNEAFNGVANQVILSKLGSLGTGISNADRDFIKAIAPSMDNTPAGNKLMIQTLRRLADRDVEVAEFASEYRKAHADPQTGKGQLDEDFPIALAQWARANPAFPHSDAQPQTPPVTGAPPPSAPAQVAPPAAAAPQPVSRVPTQQATDALKATPALRDQYDQYYGTPADPHPSSRVLGQ